MQNISSLALKMREEIEFGRQTYSKKAKFLISPIEMGDKMLNQEPLR